MNWTHTIDTGAASPQRPHTPPEAAGLRIVLAERPGERFDDDDQAEVTPEPADDWPEDKVQALRAAQELTDDIDTPVSLGQTAAGWIEYLVDRVDSYRGKLIELEDLRARVAELERAEARARDGDPRFSRL